MGFIKNRIDIKNATTINTNIGLQDAQLLKLLGIEQGSLSGKESMGEITYYTCLKVISESVAKLPIITYKTNNDSKGKEKINDSYLNYILNVEPNPYMTASTFWQAVELNRLHFGNSYLYQDCYKVGKNAGKVKSLWILPSGEVTVWQDDAGIFGQDNAIWYIWQDTRGQGKQYKFSMSEILHLKSSTSFDGIVGIPAREILKCNLEQAQYGANYLKKLYSNNLFGDKILLQYTGNLDSKAEKAIASKIESFSTDNTTSGKFIPLPIGLTASNLSSKLTDSEFSVLNQTNSLKICASLGLNPNHINDYSKSSYSNSISQSLDFLTNTLSPILLSYSQEMTRRLLTTTEKTTGMTLEHDTKSLLKLDPIQQTDVLQKQLNNFLLTPNEGREILGYEYSTDPKADQLLGNGSSILLNQVGTQYIKSSEGGDNNGK